MSFGEVSCLDAPEKNASWSSGVTAKGGRGKVGMVWGGPFKEEIPDLSLGRYTRNVLKKKKK